MALDGTATVSGSGTLSYQWYQSDDALVDKADAAEGVKNDTLLNGETNATLTVDTTEAGVFYYYVVAANTVTLADETSTAFTTSNVVTVTVKEAAPVPPADSKGPIPQGNEEAQITSLVLKDFIPHGGTSGSDVDLLTTKPVQWDIFNPYTLEIGVSLPAGVEDNTLALTLPNGMKFVNLNPENIEKNGGIARADYEEPEEIYGYQPGNGTLTVVFDSSVTKTIVTVSIQPDVAFFPVEKRQEGWQIEDAIQVELKSNNVGKDHRGIPVNVQINEEVNDGHPSYESLRIGDISDATPDVAPGEVYGLTGNVWTGWFTYNGKQNYRLRSELIVVLSVPNDLTLETPSGLWTVTKGETDSDDTGTTLWTLKATGLYNRTPSITEKVSVQIPNEAVPGTVYAVRQHSISVTTYGQDTPWTISGTENDSPLWTLTVKDPEKVEIGITAGNATNVYDYTQRLASNGQPFTDYNTALAGCILTNNGVADINQDLIYKATFDQTVQFVTAVGIPCGWDETEDEWLPTKITVTTNDNNTYTISAEDGDYSAIREVASLAYEGFGFILRAADVPEFDEAESIVSVEVELPGLPKGYMSSALLTKLGMAATHMVYWRKSKGGDAGMMTRSASTSTSRYPTTLPSPNCAAANSMALRCSRNCSTKWFGNALSTVS